MNWKALIAGVFGAGAVLAVMLAAHPAIAGTTIDDAVILDPYDPVPGIGFRRDGCEDGCEVHHRRCGDDCHRGCEDNCRHRARCGHSCHARHRCDHDCTVQRRRSHDDSDDRRAYAGSNSDYPPDAGPDQGPPASGPTYASHKPCVNGNCYDAEKWEHRWRDGTRVGREWYKKGENQRDSTQDEHDWNDGHDTDWEDNPPPPPPAPDDHHHH